jgi:hypothetical protein
MRRNHLRSIARPVGSIAKSLPSCWGCMPTARLKKTLLVITELNS